MPKTPATRTTSTLPAALALCTLCFAPGLLLGQSPSSTQSSAAAVAGAPAALAPPAGNARFLTAHAIGTQNYTCVGQPGSQTTSWVFNGPQATLSVKLFGSLNQQVITHFLSPVPGIPVAPLPGCILSSETGELNCATWQGSFDSSAIWAERAASVTAGTAPACPTTGAIPCLLLKAVQTRNGTFGPGLLGRTTYVQRLNTVGGAAPAVSCKAGDQALVPYSADYSFFSAALAGGTK